MKLKFLCLFCLVTNIILLLGLSPAIYGAPLQSGIIAGDNVNVRTGPGLDHDVICKLQQGASVSVIEQAGLWLKVQYTGEQTGWVSQQFVEVKSASDANRESSISTYPVDDILNLAHSLIGISYAYGGASLRGFDCSGFTMYVLGKFGIHLPHEASRQMTVGTPVPSREELIPGDLVFFKTLSSKVVNHVGIYIGNNLFIHAATSFGAVRISTLNDSYYDSRYVGGRRLAGNFVENSAG